jgi:hypothetical protein
MKYRIKTYLGYVCGFSNAHLCVQSSDEGKLFTKAAMTKFIEKYNGAGYGLDMEDCTIEEVI